MIYVEKMADISGGGGGQPTPKGTYIKTRVGFFSILNPLFLIKFIFFKKKTTLPPPPQKKKPKKKTMFLCH